MIQQSKFKTCTSSHTYFVNHDKPHQINNFFVYCNTKKLNIPILMADSSTKFANNLCTHPCSWIIMYTCTLATQKPDNLRSAVFIYIYIKTIQLTHIIFQKPDPVFFSFIKVRTFIVTLLTAYNFNPDLQLLN